MDYRHHSQTIYRLATLNNNLVILTGVRALIPTLYHPPFYRFIVRCPHLSFDALFTKIRQPIRPLRDQKRTYTHHTPLSSRRSRSNTPSHPPKAEIKNKSKSIRGWAQRPISRRYRPHNPAADRGLLHISSIYSHRSGVGRRYLILDRTLSETVAPDHDGLTFGRSGKLVDGLLASCFFFFDN